MAPVWHYTDKDGKRHEEPFTAAQAVVDQQVVKAFEMVEANVAAGIANDTKDISVIAEAIALLPATRARHWANELARIGAKLPEAPKPKAPAPTAKSDK